MTTPGQPEQFNQQEETLINEEYKQFKKNSPYLYDLIISKGLEWPSLTFQWLPTPPVLHDDYSVHSCILSSNTTEKQQSHILFAEIKIPLEKQLEKGQAKSGKKSEKDEVNGSSVPMDSILKSSVQKIEIRNKIPVQGEVNRARYNPNSPNLIAVKTATGDFHIFDSDAPAPTEQNSNVIMFNQNTVRPLLRLTGHSKQGYGISWNSKDKNILASGAYDKRILIWDIASSQLENQRIEPLASYDYHTAAVEDVAWHPTHRNVLASCSDDRIIALWDTRFRQVSDKTHSKPLLSVLGHTSEIYSIDFNPFNDFHMLSSSEDKDVAFWDIRKMSKRLLTFRGHEGSVFKAQWSPFHTGIFASCGADRRVHVWDLSKAGDKTDKKAGLLFTHSGHRSKVWDFDWNSYEKLVIGSVQENNVIQVWEMAKSIYYENEQ